MPQLSATQLSNYLLNASNTADGIAQILRQSDIATLAEALHQKTWWLGRSCLVRLVQSDRTTAISCILKHIGENNLVSTPATIGEDCKEAPNSENMSGKLSPTGEAIYGGLLSAYGLQPIAKTGYSFGGFWDALSWLFPSWLLGGLWQSSSNAIPSPVLAGLIQLSSLSSQNFVDLLQQSGITIENIKNAWRELVTTAVNLGHTNKNDIEVLIQQRQQLATVVNAENMVEEDASLIEKVARGPNKDQFVVTVKALKATINWVNVFVRLFGQARTEAASKETYADGRRVTTGMLREALVHAAKVLMVAPDLKSLFSTARAMDQQQSISAPLLPYIFDQLHQTDALKPKCLSALAQLALDYQRDPAELRYWFAQVKTLDCKSNMTFAELILTPKPNWTVISQEQLSHMLDNSAHPMIEFLQALAQKMAEATRDPKLPMETLAEIMPFQENLIKLMPQKHQQTVEEWFAQSEEQTSSKATDAAFGAVKVGVRELRGIAGNLLNGIVGRSTEGGRHHDNLPSHRDYNGKRIEII